MKMDNFYIGINLLKYQKKMNLIKKQIISLIKLNILLDSKKIEENKDVFKQFLTDEQFNNLLLLIMNFEKNIKENLNLDLLSEHNNKEMLSINDIINNVNNNNFVFDVNYIKDLEQIKFIFINLVSETIEEIINNYINNIPESVKNSYEFVLGYSPELLYHNINI